MYEGTAERTGPPAKSAFAAMAARDFAKELPDKVVFRVETARKTEEQSLNVVREEVGDII